jgi:N-methylhydantoinase B
MNSATGGMFGAVMSSVMTTLSYGDLPFNPGIWRPISIDLGQPGTIVNAVAPAPVTATHAETGLRAIKLVKDVLSQAVALSDDPVLRGRCSGQAQDGAGTIGVSGINQHGGTSVVYYLDTAVGQGGGAQTTMDGQDAYGPTTMVGCGMADVELHEAADPVLFLWRRIMPNSGGPGLRRGGQGVAQAYAILHTDRMDGWTKTMCAEVSPRGFGGGGPGGAPAVRPLQHSNIGRLLAEGVQPTLDRLSGNPAAIRNRQSPFTVARGDVVQFEPGGGGGLGDPLRRTPVLVVADVRAGYLYHRAPREDGLRRRRHPRRCRGPRRHRGAKVRDPVPATRGHRAAA